jgi:hypothetical protein
MRHTDAEIEDAARRFEQLADALDPATADAAGSRPVPRKLALPEYGRRSGRPECRGTRGSNDGVSPNGRAKPAI